MGWDLNAYFPEFGGSEMKTFQEKLESDLGALLVEAKSLETLNSANSSNWEKAFLSYEDLLNRFSHIHSYLESLISTDSQNEQYQAALAEILILESQLTQIKVELSRGIGSASEEVFQKFLSFSSFEFAMHALSVLREEFKFRMSSEQEALASDLGTDGISAWGRLYDTLSGSLEFEMRYPDGRVEMTPMSQRRSLFGHPDRRVRKVAFEEGDKVWKAHEKITAAAINAISGTRHTLSKYREEKNFLDPALRSAQIEQQTLDAMFEAIQQEIEIPRKIFREKAKALGQEKLAWYDLEASLQIEESKVPDWEEAKKLVVDSFFSVYPALGKFTAEAFEKNWIDWQPRRGKRSGAFCIGVNLAKESRVFMTYNKSCNDIRTMAHEFGHAFHSKFSYALRPVAYDYPMTLAETASTFAENVFAQGVQQNEDVDSDLKRVFRDLDTTHGASYMLDLPVRYAFEKKFYEERKEGEVPASRLNELMIQTQREYFGDTLEEGEEDPRFWAWKLHFYFPGVSFYNFPYTFGYLLSKGLFRMFKEEGPEFLTRYEALMRDSATDTVERVVENTTGINLRTPEFWVSAIQDLKA